MKYFILLGSVVSLFLTLFELENKPNLSVGYGTICIFLTIIGCTLILYDKINKIK